MEKQKAKSFSTVEDYFNSLPAEQVAGLEKLRQLIRKVVPKAEEVISYQMPAFKQHGVLVYYAAYANHIGFYPTSQPIIVFSEQLKGYKTSKGAIQFPWDKPLPAKLIREIVLFRVEQDKEAWAKKVAKKKK